MRENKMPLLLAILAAALGSADARWVVKDRKDADGIALIKSQNNDAEARESLLRAANQRCE